MFKSDYYSSLFLSTISFIRNGRPIKPLHVPMSITKPIQKNRLKEVDATHSAANIPPRNGIQEKLYSVLLERITPCQFPIIIMVPIDPVTAANNILRILRSVISQMFREFKAYILYMAALRTSITYDLALFRMKLLLLSCGIELNGVGRCKCTGKYLCRTEFTNLINITDSVHIFFSPMERADRSPL